MRTIFVVAAILCTPAFAQGDTPFGRPADARKAQRSVTIEMSDQMRFSPAEITVKRGEIVRFVVQNKGKVDHELVLGTLAGLKEHAAHMKMHAGAPHQEEKEEPNEVMVMPGEIGQLGWQFTKAGVFHYGCLIPGHFEAGMVGKVIVK